MVHGRRAGKGISKIGISPTSCWVNAHTLEAFSLLQAIVPRAVTEVMTDSPSLPESMAEMHELLNTAVVPTGQKEKRRCCDCHCQCSHFKVKNMTFSKNWKNYAYHLELMKILTFSAPVKTFQSHISHNTPFKIWLKALIDWNRNNKNIAIKIKTDETFITRPLYPFYTFCNKFFPLTLRRLKD